MTIAGNLVCRSNRFRPLFAAAAVASLAFAVSAFAEQPSAGGAALFERLDANHDDSLVAKEISADQKRLFDRLVRRGDTNKDDALSRKEFLAALVPSRPEKKLEPKEPAELPQADAVRYLLVSMDTNGDTLITGEEVPDDLKQVFDVLVERIDNNNNGRLERFEISRPGGPLIQIAGRFVEREGIDAAAELKNLEKKQGDNVRRFEEQRNPAELFSDPKRAAQMFAQLDGNSNNQLDKNEIPEPLQAPLERFGRLADRDKDGKLTKSEFLSGAGRMSRYFGRRPNGDPERKFNRDKPPKPRDTASDKKET